MTRSYRLSLRIRLALAICPIVLAAFVLTVVGTGVGSLLVAVVATITAWVLVHRLVMRPIQAIASAARSMRTGEPGARTSLDGEPGEIGEIARALDAMASTVEHADGRARYLSLHDPLTGLPNRELLKERLRLALARTRRRPEERFVVIFIDLDRFRVLNDSLGHQVGDVLLAQVANRLHGCMRGEDMVARLGNDEFAILLENSTDVDAVKPVLERIDAAFSVPFTFDDHEVWIRVSAGIVLSRPRYVHPEDILRDGNTALQRARAQWGGRNEVFDTAMHERVVARFRLESDLWRAVDRREFAVHYQPIVSLESRQITGFEALVRWHHPVRGLVAPNEFIPLAEETGLIGRIGLWVLEEACRQMVDWHRQFPSPIPLTLSVNLSARQVSQPDIVEQIQRVLTNTGIDRHSLALEITESAMLDDPTIAASVLTRLKELGLRVCVDDFGTGYSSLGALHRLPIDLVKIDRAFISELGADRNVEIVRAILALTEALTLDVIAEGVETPEQSAALRTLGCQRVQGYLYGMPLEPGAAEMQLALRRSLPGGFWADDSFASVPHA